jgi:hypothetical protein
MLIFFAQLQMAGCPFVLLVTQNYWKFLVYEVLNGYISLVFNDGVQEHGLPLVYNVLCAALCSHNVLYLFLLWQLPLPLDVGNENRLIVRLNIFLTGNPLSFFRPLPLNKWFIYYNTDNSSVFFTSNQF